MAKSKSKSKKSRPSGKSRSRASGTKRPTGGKSGSNAGTVAAVVVAGGLGVAAVALWPRSASAAVNPYGGASRPGGASAPNQEVTPPTTGISSTGTWRNPYPGDTPLTVPLQPTNRLTPSSWHDTVVRMQRQLNAFGAHLTVDGILGPNTAAAVRAFIANGHPLDPHAPSAPGTVGGVDNGYWFYAWVDIDNAARIARGMPISNAN